MNAPHAMGRHVPAEPPHPRINLAGLRSNSKHEVILGKSGIPVEAVVTITAAGTTVVVNTDYATFDIDAADLDPFQRLIADEVRRQVDFAAARWDAELDHVLDGGGEE